MSSALRFLVALAALFALTGIAYRLVRSRGAAEDSASPPPVASSREPAAPTPADRPRRPAQPPRPADPSASEPTPEAQTAALREASVREAIGTIRVAVLQDSPETVEGMILNLKTHRALARRLVDEAVRDEEHEAIRRALAGVRARLD